MFPWPLDVLACKALEAFAVDVGEDIKLSIGISDGRSPDALSVDLLVVLEGECIIGKVESVEAIADILPVDEVARV